MCLRYTLGLIIILAQIFIILVVTLNNHINSHTLSMNTEKIRRKGKCLSCKEIKKRRKEVEREGELIFYIILTK